MTQYTQPVVGQQQQQQLQQQQSTPPQQQQQQNTTTQTTNNNNNNNNNNMNTNSATPTTPATSTNNNQTQTIAVQPLTTNNNNYTAQQTVAAAGGGGVPVYNPQLQPTNVYLPAHHGMAGHHHPHHQPGAMYSTMIPAPLSSNVFVNNVTANVNLHGWPHTGVPHGAWVHPSGAPHYIHGDIPPEQGAPVMQSMGAMPVALPPSGPLLNTRGGGGRGGRGRGRGGGSSSRRSDYNVQRHPSQQQQQQHHHQQQQQHEGSPAPQSVGGGGQATNQQQQSQEQQTIDSQQMMSGMPYAAHHQYAAAHGPQYPYGYPTAFYAPQQQMIHAAAQSPAAQQAAGGPFYVQAMPVYNGQHLYNYGYFIPPVMNQAEYQYVPAEEVMAGPVVDERQATGEQPAMMWHQPHMYADEYGMNPAEMHAVGNEDINHNSGSAAETPTSMLSPNYAPMYEPQMHEMQHQMGVMQIYDDQQMGQMQVIHNQGGGSGVPQQIEDDLSECGSQRSVPMQMVPAGAIINTATGMPLQAPSSGGEQMQMHQQPPTHLIPAAIMPIEQTTSTNPHQQQQGYGEATESSPDNNVIDNNMPSNEFGANNNNNMQTCESVTSLNEENLQQSVENIAQDYQQQQQQQPQQVQTTNIMVDPAAVVHQDNYNVNNKIMMTDVLELQDNVPKPPAAVVAPIVNTNTVTTTNVDVAIETTTMQNNPQQQQHEKQQHIYQQDKQQPQYVATQTQGNQSVPQQQQQQQQQQVQPQQPQSYKQQHMHQQQQHHQQQQQQYHHQQLQTQPPLQHQQQQPQHHHNVTPQQQHQQIQPHQQQQQYSQQQQPPPQHYHGYDNRKSSQMYGNNQQQPPRRKYDYHNHGPTNTNDTSSANSSAPQHQSQQPTTKTMSWTNSSQHKKSTNTVAVTATPSSTHGGGGGQGGSYNKQSSTSSTNSSTSTHSHGTRTYTNQQHHNYQQQQQQHNYQQTTQTRNYGAMKMPSSPIATAPAASSSGGVGHVAMERKTSQSSDTGKSQQTTSTASTTAAPHQFQQQAAAQPALNTDPGIAGKQQYPAGLGNRKQSLGQQSQTAAATVSPAASASPSAAADSTPPPINLAPPVSTTTPAAPSTPSWASLFTTATAAAASASASATSSPAAAAVVALSTTTQTNQSNTATTALSSSTSSTANYAQKPIAKVAPFESAASVPAATPAVTPGALSYSAASAQNLPPPSAATTPAGGNNTNKKITTTLANLDEFSLKFADFLTKYKSDWTTISLRPRGLTNRSNYCYINSILQALLGCSPLYNLMRTIPKQAANLCEVKTPTINAMMSFMSNFSNLPSGLRLRPVKGGGKGNKDDVPTELQCDLAFEPTEIYKLWNDSREEHVEGRQEDAEEFLSYILNKLNDEMLEVVKLIAKPKPEQNGQNEQSEGEDGDVWQMICNNRNKGSVTRQTDFGCTPLSDIFRGELRSRLQREGEHPTDVIQPFLTLPLNIEKAASVKEALEILVGRDQLEGVTGSKSKQEVLAWQQMNVEKLPPILILHLKWFDYRSDGCTKILKKVEFPVDLKIDTKILASKKYSQKQRAYRLFAVVYHDGKEASKGHYITDVYHTGYGSWLRYDDSSVKSVSENHVLLPRTPRVPYLLYYRRCDTIPQQSNNNNNNGGGSGNNNNSSSSGNNASGGGNNTPK